MILAISFQFTLSVILCDYSENQFSLYMRDIANNYVFTVRIRLGCENILPSPKKSTSAWGLLKRSCFVVDNMDNPLTGMDRSRTMQNVTYDSMRSNTTSFCPIYESEWSGPRPLG